LDRWWTLVLKRLLLLLLGFLIGSMLIWAVLSYLMSEVLTRLVLACSFFIRWSKSRYNPKNPAQRKRMAVVLGLPLGDPESQSLAIKPPNIANIVFAIVQTVVQGLQELIQAMFDIILIRFVFVSIGAVDLRLSAFEIIIKVPNPPTIDVSGLVQALYDVASVAERFYLAVLSAMFVGAPRCEGPVVILSSCFLIGAMAELRLLRPSDGCQVQRAEDAAHLSEDHGSGYHHRCAECVLHRHAVYDAGMHQSAEFGGNGPLQGKQRLDVPVQR